jgi:hypothetical protein
MGMKANRAKQTREKKKLRKKIRWTMDEKQKKRFFLCFKTPLVTKRPKTP